MMELSWLPVSVALGAALVGAATDVWKFRVYNVLTVPLFLSGLIYHGVVNGWPGATTALLGALFGFGVLIVPYLLGLMGAGDVKLLAGVGAWVGLSGVVIAFVVSSLVAGVYATILIVRRGRLRESWQTLRLILYRFAAVGLYFGKDDLVEELSQQQDRRLRVIPYGAMIPFGVLAIVVWSLWQR